MNKEIFYLCSRHGNTGSNVMFHNKNGKGYGTDLDNLQLFTKEYAQKAVAYDVKSLPLLKSKVDELAVWHVDMQYLDETKAGLNPQSKYVLQRKSVYDGNDISFAIDEYSYTFDYTKALELSYERAIYIASRNESFAVWPMEYLKTIKHRTFQVENINTRKMTTDPGIKYKKPRKERHTTGKTRGNCHKCGKITWNFNPYENAYCSTWCER